MTPIDLRDAPAWHPAALALNAAHETETSPLDIAGLASRLSMAALAPAFVEDGTLLGFVLAFGAGEDLPSQNYAWVERHLASFLYIDRVITAPSARGRGIGRALYGTVEDAARRAGLAWLACEINADPPNPGSDRFHDRLGFETMGHARTSGRKQVRFVRRAVR
jgi:predicted GNAT superfamily acetyltransferase